MYYLINAALRFFGELKVICLPLGSEWELTLSDVYVAPRPPIHGVQSGGYASNGMWGPNSSYKHHMLPPTTLPPPRALQPRALTSPPLALTSPPPADRRADRPPAGGNRVTQNRVRILTYALRPRAAQAPLDGLEALKAEIAAAEAHLALMRTRLAKLRAPSAMTHSKDLGTTISWHAHHRNRRRFHRGLHKGRRNLRCTFRLNECTSLSAFSTACTRRGCRKNEASLKAA